MTKALNLEHSFTSTVASLAPAKSTNEQVLPGGIYVLVASMAGSIVSRNRNILVRGATPLAVGIGAGWYVLPYTMRNISDLLWEYEKKAPVIADAHLRTRERLVHIWETGKAHSGMTLGRIEDAIGEGREKVEDWVKKGK
jgi:MICOS complex subunit MIC26